MFPPCRSFEKRLIRFTSKTNAKSKQSHPLPLSFAALSGFSPLEGKLSSSAFPPPSPTRKLQQGLLMMGKGKEGLVVEKGRKEVGWGCC
jgi:hypothetical protein